MKTLSTWKVLLVEDNLGDAHLVSLCTHEHPRVQVFNAANLILANRYLQRLSPFEDVAIPSLVLLDLGLPMHSGMELITSIRASPELKHLPVIVLTSCHIQRTQERCIALGATEYVVKPAIWSEWQKTVSRIFREYLPDFSG